MPGAPSCFVQAKETTMDRTDLGGGGISNNGRMGADVQDEAKQKLEQLQAWSGQILDRVEVFVRDRPGTAVLCAIGVGFLVGRLVRR
jgi:hypothetical protein